MNPVRAIMNMHRLNGIMKEYTLMRITKIKKEF
jgi:hypothetical protein